MRANMASPPAITVQRLLINTGNCLLVYSRQIKFLPIEKRQYWLRSPTNKRGVPSQHRSHDHAWPYTVQWYTRSQTHKRNTLST